MHSLRIAVHESLSSPHVPPHVCPCRTVIWHGEEDISVPKEHGEWWARTIPNAKLTVVPGEGHITLMIRQAGPILEAAAAAARDEEASH